MAAEEEEEEKTPRELAEEIRPITFLSRAALIDEGIRARHIAHLVANGELIRLRNGRYVKTGMSVDLVRAGRLGARLDCISLLRAIGIFVHTHDRLHVQVEHGSTRLPAPDESVVRHWRRSSRDRGHLTADVVEALAQSFRCQSLREAIATLDSAWHHGVVDEEKVKRVFDLLPRRYRRLRALLDRRAESGPESLMRLMLRGLGCHVDVQVEIRGVGRVDFVVDGWLIVECDSKKYHEGWDNEKRDRRRDFAAAAQGYVTIRPIAEDILYNPEKVLAMLKQVLAHPPYRIDVQNSAMRGGVGRGGWEMW
ncbi:DUF559 domain-containing protein [Microbacterium protaetiae]|uniref:DUF559 domain-containing protein n=1 Tax=Microbacterium protaetiae TaxID=2509458 RepID=A0A4P6EFI9_9MICO|nr:DUF559 domain-containing protein [Microbacterium protaetiae]QAY60576.1 DUF559 domain-containing protein [Microbacterium protaetiae]